MRFDVTDDQRAFADSIDAIVAASGDVERLRRAWERPGDDAELWRRLVDVGLISTTFDEAQGGGGSLADGAVALERVGYHAIAAPVVESGVVAPGLACLGDADIDSWLADVASGSARIAVVAETSGLCPHAHEADAFVVLDGSAVRLPSRADVAVEAVRGLDPSLGLGRVAVTANDVAVSRDSAVADRLRALLWTGSALTLVGTAQRLLDMTCAYVRQREQFGRVIGSFQAVKHRLADTAVAVEAARGLAWSAAVAADHDRSRFTTAARCAKSAASTAAVAASSAGLQLHGGVGFTAEHDLHLFIHRARTVAALHGSADEHREAVGRDLICEGVLR